jgi:hypothetical protein
MKMKHLMWFLGVAGFYVAALIAGIRGEAGAKTKQYELERMFRSVVAMPGATATGYQANHEKISHGRVGSTYTGDLHWPDIRSYYDRELLKEGWQFVSEESVTDWGTDKGGRSRLYLYGGYYANLQFAGERARYGWTYALDFSWGLH